MAFLAKPIVALGFGAFFFCGAFLLIGGFASRRDWTNGYAYQVAGWAAMASLLFGSVVGNSR